MSHDDIRAALEAATPRPWHAWDRGIGYEVHVGPDCEVTPDARCSELNGEFRETFTGADAHLIAHAPEWLSELLAEVDEAQAEAHNAQADYDRRGERLWRLAALAGWTPDEADNDATAELYIKNRLAEVRLLARWKNEALPVIAGLQELGAALGIPLGKHITGPDALEAVKALTARAEAAEQTIQRVRGLAEAWATQPNDYDEDTEQQIEDGQAILRALDGGEQHG